jgi:tRNA wybutosine-synthesizing protein 2
MRVVAVPKGNAESLRRALHAHGFIDRSVRIAKRGDEVLIPVTAKASVDLERFGARYEGRPKLASRLRPPDPRRDIEERLRARGVPAEFAPHRWERIGDVLVIRVSAAARPHAETIARVCGEALRVRTVAEDRSGIHGPMRTPDIRVLWGDDTETVHVEGGVRYALDVGRIMFSSGNLAERLGLPARIRPGSVVVDLFAGIGYFALPIALRSRARLVYACEVNPVAFHYLTTNIRSNRATNVVPRLGNCRKVAPRAVADWVLMGHFDAREYLDVAFDSLQGRGTIVYHELCPKEQYPDAMTRRLAAAARSRWMNVVSIRTRIVKSYAPGILHASAELDVTPQTRGRATENQINDRLH